LSYRGLHYVVGAFAPLPEEYNFQNIADRT